jgi:hypothetical protein
VGEPFGNVAKTAANAATANAADPSPTPKTSAMPHAATPTVTRDALLPPDRTTRIAARITAPAASALFVRFTSGGSHPLIAALANATAQTRAIVDSTIHHECVARAGAWAVVWVVT